MSAEVFSLYFRKHSVFSGLDEKALKELLAVARKYILKKGAGITISHSQASRIYFLVNGKMKITNSQGNDDQSVKDILHAGEMFGHISLNGRYAEEHAEALVNDTVIYCFGAADFKQLMGNNHRLALNYADHLSRKLNALRERYEIWTRYDTRTKFLYLLKKWACSEGKEINGSIVLNNYLSLTDIADILSVSRQFMHVLIKEMTTAGLLKYSRKQIELKAAVLKDPFPG